MNLSWRFWQDICMLFLEKEWSIFTLDVESYVITPIRTADGEMVKALTMLTTNSFVVPKLPAPIEPLESNTKYMSAFGILQTAKEIKHICTVLVFSKCFELTK